MKYKTFLLIDTIRCEGLVDFSQDGNMAHASFEVEKSSTISRSTITRLIHKQESKYVSAVVNCEWNEVKCESLPYFVSVALEKRG